MEEKFEGVLKQLSKKNLVYKKIYIIKRLREELPKYIPENLSKNVTVKNYLLKDKIVEIACADNYVKQEILFREKLLLNAINSILENETINRIRIVS
ncbi:hypothetical protein Pmob_0178 [Petrotoga mobilis SJ95]|jgi:hypothetical protein|uniref:DUF721 domain-containing protein n=1 Tax=Petrotoga mobilis (strain DSM 10674 / SJ95) TaxID=403833 RepID=A9BFE0_PETMO|nr:MULTISPECIES: DciA family protein [Petrotoga]MDK2812487.1 hypothetical protein [Petrotoga sp.]ABX30925.1 hypothetical protein Pmob_0178 [Petrotoga mobilis SJ95]PNR88682.1 hypothetical protein X925_05650 [Petrotoga sp. 9T1HF07.CasAA.8.2]PNR92725.1 hypothetical protein X926_05895 [Petrotoga sp. HWHPT.55.6.3]RLL83358.1 hypothetical protein BZ25_07905 [Petrotoga sp. Shatin.DS.tank11.9.2.9.3]